MLNNRLTKPEARKKRVRAKMEGSAQKPRLSVYRSNKHIYVQAIDDQGHQTIASASDVKATDKVTKTDRAKVVAAEVAKQLKAKKVEALIFDRGHYKYHGRVKAIAEALREEGLHV